MQRLARRRKMSDLIPYKCKMGVSQHFFKILVVGLLGSVFLCSLLNNYNVAYTRGDQDQDRKPGLLDGMLAARPQGDDCVSRVEHHFYRKRSKYKPSNYLISKLRQYEMRHRKCAAEATKFNYKPQMLNKGNSTNDCKFVVWIDNSGLGNRMITLAATFLYALITNRVLLVDRGKDIQELFCEPFPGASWLLPPTFSQQWLQQLDETSLFRFGRMLDRGKCISNVDDITTFFSIQYIHLTHTYNVHDRRFFCEPEQQLLQRVPWLFFKSNIYFVPSFYFMPSFRSEMIKMFPEQQTIFHHLGRYLLHPSNSVWSKITRFYNAYLADAQLLVGLQLRTFDASVKLFSDQLLQCLLMNKILPNVTDDEGGIYGQHDLKSRSISVLVTSLKREYYDRLKDMYAMSTEDGSRVKIYQPSHEQVQMSHSAEHDGKALMEIYLLSLSDVLVTSPMSTFGYTAQGLGGLKPWILRRIEDIVEEQQQQQHQQQHQQQQCFKAVSMEPCFHAPPLYDCECQGGRDPGSVADAVQHCRDVSWGIQLVDEQKQNEMKNMLS